MSKYKFLEINATSIFPLGFTETETECLQALITTEIVSHANKISLVYRLLIHIFLENLNSARLNVSRNSEYNLQVLSFYHVRLLEFEFSCIKMTKKKSCATLSETRFS